MSKKSRRSSFSFSPRPSAPTLPPSRDDWDLIGNSAMLRRVQLQEQFQEQLLELLLKKRLQEHEALDAWNVNAEGRNQGLVHLVDYAYARPMASLDGMEESDRKLLQGTDELPLSGSALVERLSGKEKQFETLKSKGTIVPYLDGKGRPLGLNDEERARLELLHELTESLRPMIQEREEKLQETGQALRLARGRGEPTEDLQQRIFEIQKELKPLKLRLKAFEDHKDGIVHWRIGRDESKGGRMKALGIARGDEILEGTRRARALLEAPDRDVPISVHSPTREMEMWKRVEQKDENGEPCVTWERRTLPPKELSDTVTAQVEGDGMELRLWGVLPPLEDSPPTWDTAKASMRISTMIPKNPKSGKAPRGKKK